MDTIKEKVFITNLDKHALSEIETSITSLMIEAKQKYAREQKSEEE